MAVLKDLIKADASLSGKARVKSAIDTPRIAMGAYAYLRDGEGNVSALDKAEQKILKSGDEALISEWESLVEELNKASSEFIKTYMEAKDSPLQKLAKLTKSGVSSAKSRVTAGSLTLSNALREFESYLHKYFSSNDKIGSLYLDIDTRTPKLLVMEVVDDGVADVVASYPITTDDDYDDGYDDNGGNDVGLVLRVGKGRRPIGFVYFYDDGDIMADQLGWLQDLVK